MDDTEIEFRNIEIDENFDHIYYGDQHPESSTYWQPYCKNKDISERIRLFHHYIEHGIPNGWPMHGPINTKEDDEFKCIYIKPIQGLGNRLQFVDSILAFCREHSFYKVKMFWSSSAGFSDEKFEDLFDMDLMPLKLEMIDEETYNNAAEKYLNLQEHFSQDPNTLQYTFDCDPNILLYKIQHESFCAETFACVDWLFPNLELNMKFDFIKRNLQPSASLNEQLKKINILSSDIGLHIRRGDATIGPWAEHYLESKISYFDGIVSQITNDTPDQKFFLSTDCEETQDYFLNKYPDIIITNPNKIFTQTNITVKDTKPLQSEAVVDLFALSRTCSVFGTNFSTFGSTAAILGGIGLTELTYDTWNNLKHVPVPDISLFVGVKNRFNVLKTSIHSWLLHDQIKEIVIVDWSSDDGFCKEYLEDLDRKIKVISVPNRKKYDISKVLNVGIKHCTYNHILKVDVDYVFNPYNRLCEWLRLDWDSDFLTGYWQDEEFDSKIGFLGPLNGFLAAKKEHILKVNCYNEDFVGYGWDDTDMHNKLLEIGLNRKILKFKKHYAPIFHTPHGDEFRFENQDVKNVPDSIAKNRDMSNYNIDNYSIFQASNNKCQ